MANFAFLGRERKPFIGHLEKYSKNLGEFLDCITEKGIECGYQPKGDKFTLSASSSSRPKGKARKKKQEKFINPFKSNNGANTEKILLNVKELMLVADQIVKHRNPAVVIPNRFISAGIHAVTMLSEYRIKIGSLENNTMGKLTFESILEEVIVSLQPCIHFPGRNFQTTEILNYEALKQLIGIESVPWFKQICRTEITFNEDLTDEKIAAQQLHVFALFSVFLDFNNIHSTVLNTWQKYKDGEIDSITASVITNVGFNIAIRQCKSTTKNLCIDYQDALTIILHELNYTIEEYHNKVNCATLEWIFCREFLVLDELRTQDFSDQSSVSSDSQDQIIDNDLFKTEDGRYIGSGVRFSMVFSQIRLMKKLKIYPYSEDELTKGILDLLDKKLVPFWLPFALRVFLDVDSLLDDRVEEVLYQLRQVIKQVVKQQDRFFEISPVRETIPFDSWGQQESLSKMIDGVEKDKISASWPIFGDIVDGERQEFLLLKYHPILSGYTAFHICMGIYRFGIRVCNLNKDVGLIWQIYISLRLRGFPLASWPLMDKLEELNLLELKNSEGLSNKEIGELVRAIGTTTGLNNERLISSYSTKNPLIIIFHHIESMHLIYPRFFDSKVSENIIFYYLMVTEFLNIIPSPSAEELSRVDKGTANLNASRCYDINRFLFHFSNATSAALEYLLFPFLNLQEQCFKVVIAINAAQIINQQISLKEDQAGTQHTENDPVLQSTDFQSDSSSTELTAELDLVVNIINSYTEDWAYNGINRTNWPAIISTFSPSISHDFMKYWKIRF
ncbi:hypothetical protein EPUL_005993, partial [Erysiphe pulchra]